MFTSETTGSTSGSRREARLRVLQDGLIADTVFIGTRFKERGPIEGTARWHYGYPSVDSSKPVQGERPD